MPYLVDGNNLMGRAAVRGLGGPTDRRGVVAALAALAAGRGGRFTVVFDGAPDAHFAGDVALGPVRVEFAAPRSADDRILARVRAARNPRDLTVVTDDRALAADARGLGARVAGVNEFLDRLASGGGRPAGAKGDAGPVDVAFWEDYFSGRTDDD
ncbi:MAG TPA: NYN domain-containing protein [Acidobacteriota bacterium]|nr:NYN domain-containing protein [Acidobacteriota bacterium]HQM64836.1 NYN domain-containing protein [Acidobacteriota bacterium]